MRRRKDLLVAATILFALFLFTNFLLGESRYAKQSRLDLVLNTLAYSTKNQFAAVQNVFKPEKKFMLEVPFSKQEHAVTCEVAALGMVLNYYGFPVKEDDLIDNLYFDTTEPMTKDRVWGDPDKGFVGSVDGSVFDGTGYGVHDAPIRTLAKKYRNAVEVSEPDITKIVGLLKSGKPVIAWGLLSSRSLISWRSYGGKRVEVYPGEHARVVVGYVGDEHNPDKLILLDPIYGEIRMSTKDFLKDWEMMNKRAVVVL